MFEGWDPNKIETQARAELKLEDRRARIDAAKQRLREAKAKRKWWHRLVPFVIRIERRK